MFIIASDNFFIIIHLIFINHLFYILTILCFYKFKNYKHFVLNKYKLRKAINFLNYYQY